MDIYANKGFTLSQGKAVQFGEYPATKSVKQSKFTSSNSLSASVEFGEYAKTTKEVGMDSEYNPSDLDILQATSYGDNVKDIQSFENNGNEQTNFEVLETDNYTREESAQFGEYPTTYKNNETSFNHFLNADKSNGEYININSISGNLESNDYQITDSNINIDTTYQTTENLQGFETLYGESNSNSQNTYELNGNVMDNINQNYDEYQSTTKIEPLETGFEEINIWENTPKIEEYQIKDQIIGTSDSIDTVQMAISTPTIDFKEDLLMILLLKQFHIMMQIFLLVLQ